MRNFPAFGSINALSSSVRLKLWNDPTTFHKRSGLLNQVDPHTDLMVAFEERSIEYPLVNDDEYPRSRRKLFALSLVLSPRIRFPGVSTAPLTGIKQKHKTVIRSRILKVKNISPILVTTRGDMPLRDCYIFDTFWNGVMAS